VGGTSSSLARAAVAGLTVVTATWPLEAGAQSGPSAEELYDDYFGCWTCHGPRGQGGDGQPLRGTYLPLALFIKALRMPAGEMPPFGDVLATDRELTAVYAWLEGVDPIVQPLPLDLTLRPAGETEPDGLEVTVEARSVGEADPMAAFGYRATLLRRDDSLVADQPIEVGLPGRGDGTSIATDRYGQARWDRMAADGPETVRLRIRLPAGEYTLVVEAVGPENPEDPVILGIGSTVLQVE
jgi:mono/diheme cytochrome c family protein